jgi:hypothetical protein
MISPPRSSPRDTAKDRSLKQYLSRIVSERHDVDQGVNYGKRGQSLMPIEEFYPFQVLKGFTQADYDAWDALPLPKDAAKTEWKVRGGAVYFTEYNYKISNNPVDGYTGDSLYALHSIKPATTDPMYEDLMARIETELFSIYCVYDFSTLYYTVKTPDELEEAGDLKDNDRVILIAKVEQNYIEQYFNCEILDAGKFGFNENVDQFQVYECKQYYFKVRKFQKTVDGVAYVVDNTGTIQWTGEEDYSDPVLLDLNTCTRTNTAAVKYLYLKEGDGEAFGLDLEETEDESRDLFGGIYFSFNGEVSFRVATIDGVNTQQIILELDKAGIRVSGGYVEQYRIDGKRTFYPGEESTLSVDDSGIIKWTNATSVTASNVVGETFVSDFVSLEGPSNTSSTIYGKMLHSMIPETFTVNIIPIGLDDDTSTYPAYGEVNNDVEQPIFAYVGWYYQEDDTTKASNVSIYQVASGSIIQDLRNYAPFRVFKTMEGGNKIKVCGGTAQVIKWDRIEYDTGSYQFQNRTSLIYPLDITGDISWEDDPFSERTLSGEYEVVANCSIWAKIDIDGNVMITPVLGITYDPTPADEYLLNNNIYWVKLASIELYESGKVMVIHQHHVGSIIITTYGIPQLCVAETTTTTT